MGRLTNLNPPKALTEADIPADVARDAEVTLALADHVQATDPHPSLWARISSAFLAITGGQRILKNNPPLGDESYIVPNNTLELTTNNGTSFPILGFHRGGVSATALYHAGYGNQSLRIRNADGYDSELLHRSNHTALDNPHPQYSRKTVYKGNMPTTAGHSASFIHGIPEANIEGFHCMVLGAGGFWVLPNSPLPNSPFAGYDWTVTIFQTVVNIRANSDNSSNVLGRPYRCIIFHL